MAQIVISNVDESVKENFEQFCAKLLISTTRWEQQKSKTKSQRQGEALDELIAALKTIDNEPLDEEFDEIVSKGIAIREVDL